jgi:hypothetical protein
MVRINNIRILIITLVMLFITNNVISQTTTLYSNDFESSTTGYITSTTKTDAVWKYEWTNHASCTSNDIWRIDGSGGYGTSGDITGNYASIDYGSSSCVQDISFATREFTPTQNTINVSFDWAFKDYTGSTLIIKLYDSAGNPIHTLVSVSSDDNGKYIGSLAVTAGTTYSIDFRYTASWDYGAKIDNISVTEMASGYSETTVGTGTSESSLVPAYGYYDYSWSEMIYTQAEINTAGTIKSVSFYVDDSSPSSYTMNNQKIFLGHTSATQFDGSPAEDVTSDITVTDYTECFSGSITFVHGWNTITLDQDFAYNNSNNLVVKLENRDGSYASPYPAFDYTTSSNKAAYKYNDGSYPTGNGTRTSIRPNMRFMFYTGGALPIQLVSFVGEVVDEYIDPSVELEWVVASQANNDYFTIQHSMDGYAWNELYKIPGAGNSSYSITYNYTHINPESGYNYYRLSQTDYNGKFETFNPISVNVRAEKKYIIGRYNILGQPVDDTYTGMVIIYWDNGEKEKIYINNN